MPPPIETRGRHAWVVAMTPSAAALRWPIRRIGERRPIRGAAAYLERPPRGDAERRRIIWGVGAGVTSLGLRRSLSLRGIDVSARTEAP